MIRKRIGRVLSGGVTVLCIVLLFALDVSGQGFEAREITFTISGSVGLSGVTMKGLPGDPLTDENGFYNVTVKFGWSGTVTPVREGYTFEPSGRSYSKLTGSQSNQDYMANLIQFTISGTTGLEGVVMSGLPGNPITAADGKYSAKTDYGFTGTVTPMKEGYAFSPSNRDYTQIKRDQTNQDYTSAKIKLTISGTTGIDGVVMKGLPGNPVTGGAGSYSATVDYSWSGAVMPEKEGYTFEPPSREYTELISPQNNQNYTATVLQYTISGTTDQDSVVLKGFPGDPVSDANGYYRVAVDHGWSGKVTPTKDGYTFEPANRSYSKVIGGQGNQDYTASLIRLTMSGTIGVEGVVMNGLPGNPVSGAGGLYSVVVDYGWSGTVAPEKEGYTFDPINRIYSFVGQDQVNQNYTSAKITFTISGSTGISGVVMSGLPKKPVTGADGTYSDIVEYNWSGEATPTRPGYTFDPPSRKYTEVSSSQISQNYTGALIRHTISGTIASAKGPVEGVFILADSGGGSGTTDENGNYELAVDYGWRGAVLPAKEGYTFKPTNRKYETITRDMTAQGYTAEVIMRTISGKVVIGGIPIEGVLLTANNGGGSDTTDAEGRYEVQVPYGWSGELTPTKAGFEFNPPSMPFTNVTTNYKEGKPEIPREPERREVETRPKPPEPTVTRQVPSKEVTVEPERAPVEVERTPIEREIEDIRKRLEQLQKAAEGQVPEEVPGLPEIPEGEIETRYPGQKMVRGAPEVYQGPLISAIFVETDIREALQEIADQSGVDIYADDTVKDTTVTCQFRNTPLELALQTLLKDTGYTVKRIPHSYLVYRPITNIFVDEDIRTALQTIAMQSGVVIVPDENVTGLVTCDLKGVPLETALEIVLAGTGFAVRKRPNYYLVGSSNPEHPGFREVSETRRVKLNYLRANQAVALLSPAFRNYVQADANTVCVTAPSVLAERIISDLKGLDKKPRHVLLDARIVVMERGDLLNLGVEWGWPTVRAGLFGSDHRGYGTPELDFGGNWPWGVQIGYSPDATFTDSLLLALNLLRENGEADIIASPQVLAQDGKLAQIRVLTEEYYMMTPPEAMLYYSLAQLETITSGTTLTITPHIGDNNDITLELAVEVSDSIPRGRGSELPVVTRRTASNTVRVKDGGTVALAGLTENKKRLKQKRVPGLSNIPVLGNLFKYTETDESLREVAVFVTAKLVRETGPGFVEQAESKLPMGPLGRIPMEPVGDEFKRGLQESLLRLPK